MLFRTARDRPSQGTVIERYHTVRNCPGLPFHARRSLERLAHAAVLAEYFGAANIEACVACKLKQLDTCENEIGPKEYAWHLPAE